MNRNASVQGIAALPTTPPWLAGVAGIAGLLLLLALSLVLRQSVQRGVEMRRANAARAEATWRCNALRVQLPREGCAVH
jgi:heme exporter protein D